jgi:thiol-disulfide isomerase/thioredoxin
MRFAKRNTLVKYAVILLIAGVVAYFGYKQWSKKEGLTNPDIPSSGNALVYVFMKGCGFCEKQDPVFAKLSKSTKNVNFIKLDGKENADFTKQHKIDGFPTLLFFKNGKKVDSNSGFLDETQLSDKIKKTFA